MKIIFQIYKAKDGWRWRALCGRKIVAESGEAYQRIASPTNTLRNLVRSIQFGAFDIHKPEPAKRAGQ